MKLLDTQTIASSTEININFNGLRSHNKGKGSFLDASGKNNYVRYDDKMAKEGNVPMDLSARIYAAKMFRSRSFLGLLQHQM